ncbi:MAG: mandelate racemase/muconate lactonizing enzyme family protein [Chloroflexi bacterium]|nr:mandelate racemase/muconate lactonizing enzyme family protein [Chloroflexota bacterium]MBV9899140.1 mandelate racemase/muconate lactonizing enzyme family protein [Chloroflexota bacterium]
MRITRIRPWHVTGPAPRVDVDAPRLSYVFLQVDTDEGLTGWGEITTYPGTIANRTIVAALEQVGEFLRGEDPLQIEAVWHKVFRAFTYMGTRGATTAMASAVDIALWDIKGQALGVPIHQLLGGRVRETVPLYTHFQYARTVEQMVANASAEVARGSRAIKTDPFMAAGGLSNVRYIDGQIDRSVENTAVAMIAGIRSAVGADIEVLIDAHALYNVPTAIRLANRLAPYDITWFEEPCPPESYDALEQVRSQIPVRISVGERLYTRFEFLPVLNRHLSDYVMPDVTWTGGISELKKIATLAETFYVPISPHDASGPINILAGAQVVLTVPNFYRLEARRVDLEFYSAFLEEPLHVRDGALLVSERAGLGNRLNLEYLQAHEVSNTR